MTVHLMNAANMPQAGSYKIWNISEQEFSHLLRKYAKEGIVKSYVGYPQNIQYLEQLTGIRFLENRDQTKSQPGDMMLIMKLPYRPENKDVRAVNFRNLKFDFFAATYFE